MHKFLKCVRANLCNDVVIKVFLTIQIKVRNRFLKQDKQIIFYVFFFKNLENYSIYYNINVF